jgi:hypothetical protein
MFIIFIQLKSCTAVASGYSRDPCSGLTLSSSVNRNTGRCHFSRKISKTRARISKFIFRYFQKATLDTWLDSGAAGAADEIRQFNNNIILIDFSYLFVSQMNSTVYITKASRHAGDSKSHRLAYAPQRARRVSAHFKI